MRSILIGLTALLVSSVAAAGDFVVTGVDPSGVWVDYSGDVRDGDSEKLAELMEECGDAVVYITINSPGGSAFEGIDLFWEAERHANLVTIAGKDFGAWSAAAVFWLGSPRDWFEGADAKVGFHAAYCQWWNPPGCDTTLFQMQLVQVLCKAGFDGLTFNFYLNEIQAAHGVSGWALLTDEGWFFHNSDFDITFPLIPNWTY